MLYIFSPEEELLALLSPDFTHSSSSGGVTKQTFLSEAFPAEFDSKVFDGCLYWGAIHKEVLNGENIFQFTIPSKQIQTAYVQEGNLVAFRDLDSYWQFFEIKRLVDLHEDGLTRTAFCEHIFYELIDDIVTDKRPSGSAIAALSGMLENTRWQVGIVDDLGSASASAYYISALEAVQKVANAWKGELRWRCVVEGGIITRYVDLVAMRGVDTGKQFVYSKDILSVEREVDISTVATALYGRGKGVELESGGFGRRLTFADIETPDKPLGQEWIGDSDALTRWGRPGGRHRFDVFTDEEETDAEKLLEKTRIELEKRTTPRTTYRLKVVNLEQLLTSSSDVSGEYFVQPEQYVKVEKSPETDYSHEQVRLGDLTRVIDREFVPELLVSARIVEIERDLLDPAETEIVLGSFAPSIVEATINTGRRIDDLANKPYNTKWLDGIIDVLQNAIENRQAYIWETPQGTLHMNAPTYEQATEAMLLGGGRFAIANQKDGQGGWNWRTFGDGSGFTGDLINAGKVRAEFIQVGSATTFEAGYDPTKGSMGVDADCLGLWHFDGSLNSHKGVAVDSDGAFGDGCFGQALNIATGKKLKAPTTGMDVNAGTVNFRAKNLSESANGSVLVDLPKSDNSQGILAGIANDGKIYLTDNTTTAYGPNKSTLAGWDSISLAWKPERLSLVVNDEEACYIENPGLPAAFGSNLFIGTDRNGANAINTLVDELRVDKVYRDATTRIAWHKTGVPFYTSEDMKQWPDYARMETTGFKVYDGAGNLRTHNGQHTQGKYGFKAMHTDGSFTTLDADGLLRHIASQEKNYLFMVHGGEASTYGECSLILKRWVTWDGPKKLQVHDDDYYYSTWVDGYLPYCNYATYHSGGLDKYGLGDGVNDNGMDNITEDDIIAAITDVWVELPDEWDGINYKVVLSVKAYELPESFTLQMTGGETVTANPIGNPKFVLEEILDQFGNPVRQTKAQSGTHPRFKARAYYQIKNKWKTEHRFPNYWNQSQNFVETDQIFFAQGITFSYTVIA